MDAKLVALTYAIMLSSVALADPTPEDPAWQAWQQMVSEDGTIHMPAVDFRRDWAVLGTWSLTDDDGAVTGQHVVYSQPDTITAYRETGAFPDGAVLIKELLSVQSGTLTTGNAAWATDVSGWFVMIKDQNKRFKGNAQWGNGWGWAYFDAADPAVSPTKSFRSECLGCHVPAKKTDWIYTYAYPVLQKSQ